MAVKVVHKCAKMHSLSWVKLTFAVVIFQGIEMGQRKTDSTKRKNRGLYLWWQQEVPTKSFFFSYDDQCQCYQLRIIAISEVKRNFQFTVLEFLLVLRHILGRGDTVENLGIFCHSDFTWNQVLRISSQNCETTVFAIF